MTCRPLVHQLVLLLPIATNPRPFIGRYLVQKVLQPEDGTFTHTFVAGSGSNLHVANLLAAPCYMCLYLFFGHVQAEVIEWFFTTYFSMEALLRTASSVARNRTLNNFPGFTFQPHPVTLDADHTYHTWILLGSYTGGEGRWRLPLDPTTCHFAGDGRYNK